MFGASRHAAAHHYVETHRDAVALLVAGRWPACGRLPVWRSVESPAFLRRFGRLPHQLPDTLLDATTGPLAPAIDAARRSSRPVVAELGLVDRGGRARSCSVEVFNNRHCHLVFAAERVAPMRVRAA
jgi:hypothetical protein